MTDIIQLLPDSVANQIAAGEVVQRPASAVKELLENAIDAGATRIQLLVEDAGKTRLQVIDNGKGMSETDARMAFERHATSKISKAEDLFSLFTKGFRGEALASIAAVAQVQLQTKTAKDELGTRIRVEGSKVVEQNLCAANEGSNFEVKNLFFNIPARRNFLKSDQVELRHIIDEFERVALPHYDIHFSMHHNGHELFDLPTATLRRRIVNIFGSKFNEKLVPVDEQTPILKLSGFICKPEFAKKTRGEQFFFANNRFIKNNYLHKAVCTAFQGLISEDNHPSYFLFLEIDPQRIDVNIHPTKTEIKFEDEKAIFTIIRTAVKHALGQYNIAPTLDFEVDQQFSMQAPKPGTPVEPPGITVNPNFNPFDEPADQTSKRSTSANQHHHHPISPASQNWESIMNELPELDAPQQENLPLESQYAPKTYTQVGGKYIMGTHGDGLIMVHQQRAHERILFERILTSLSNHNVPSQQLLFPQNLTFSAADYALLQELFPSLREMGFDIDPFGHHEVVINGVPLYLEESKVTEALEHIIEQEKNHQTNDRENQQRAFALSMAKVSAIKVGQVLSQKEMSALVDELFATNAPYVSVQGKPTIANLNLSDLDKSFT
jgi:DNA mismatch repair protein MutL